MRLALARTGTFSIGICGLLLAIGSPARAMPDETDDWIRVRTEHFELYSDAGPRKAKRVGRRLEELRETLGETSRGMTLNSPVPTRIFVFKNRDSFEPYVFRDDEDGGLAGYFLRTDQANYVAIDAAAVDVPFPTIYHEYLHYFLENNVPGIPLWLNEGFGEFFSTFAIRAGRAEIGLPVDRHLLWLMGHPWIPFDELFAVDKASADYNEGERQGTFYAQSWLITHYLMTNPETRGKMGKLFKLLSDGEEPWTAFDQAFGVDRDELADSLEAHFEDGASRYYVFTPPEPFDDHEVSVEPVARAEVLTRLGDLLTYCCESKAAEAERYLTTALELDRERVDARLALATLLIDRGAIEDAGALCAEAVRLDPQNARAYGLRGRAILMGYVATLDESAALANTAPPEVVEARKLFRKALQLDAGDLESVIGFGSTFLFQSEEVLEGLTALERAYAVMPARLELLSNLVALNARAGRVDEAWRLLDDHLRPRGDAETTAAAEAAVVEVEWSSIVAMLERGEFEAGLIRLSELTASVHDPDLRAQLRQQASRITTGVTAANVVDLYNQAVTLANHGRFEEAATLFDRVVDSGGGEPEMVEAAREHAVEIRKLVEHNRQVDRYNLAVDKLRQGQREEAKHDLEALLGEELPPDMREQIEKLLAEL